MQQAPVRIFLALRPNVPLGVLLGSAISTVVFAATPFLLPAIAAETGRSIGLVGLISTAQLGGFVVATWGAGRLLRPRRRILVIAAVIGVAVNIISAVTPVFAVLVLARFLSGMAIGLIDWISWSEVFGNAQRTADVAVIGPLIGTIAAPVLATVIDAHGSTWLFAVLALLHLVPLPFLRTTTLSAATRPRQERHRPVPAAAVLLACLGALTLGGSAIFVFAADIGRSANGMTALAVSLAFSLNALASVPSARWRRARRNSGLWVVVTGVAALAVTTVYVPAVFLIAMAAWGFSFWAAVPGAFGLLASRSRYPEERAGDAQAVMAIGRVFGPLLGGLLYVTGPTWLLGAVGGGLVIVAGAVMLAVERVTRPLR